MVEPPRLVSGFALEQVEEIGSTSAALRARAEDDPAAEDLALLARRQTSGRGRLGRPWSTVDGNLHLSVLLRPPTLRWPGHWSVLAAVALADAVRPCLPDPGILRLKWPNDLLLCGGKLAGVLLEAGAAPHPWLVIGFGVNLAGAPPGLGRPAACLADWRPAPPPPAFAARLLAALAEWRERYNREGFEPVRAAWLVSAHRPGEPIVAGVGATRVHGAFRGLRDDGALLLDTPAGPVAVAAGEVE